MVNKKHIITVLAILLIAVSAAGCMDAIEREGEYITYTDQMDREVEVVEDVETIISLAPANTEMLYELGLGDKVIGVTNFCDYPPEVEDVDSIGDYQNPSVETIIDKDPDVVFASGDFKEPVEQLEDKGISVIVITPDSYEELLDSITLISEVAGVEDAGEELANEIEEQIDQAQDKVAEFDERDALYVIWIDDPMFVAGQETYQNDLLKIAGANNILEQTGHFDISYEVLVDINPEVILVSGHATMEDRPPTEVIMDDEKLQSLDAVQNEEVYEILEDETSRPSPRVVDGVNSIMNALYDIELE